VEFLGILRGLSEVKVSAKTLIAGKDTGEWTNLEELVELCSKSKELLERAIAGQTNWEEVVVTKEFGSKTRAEALGRITTHTAYHAGQLALILKYGV